MSEQNVTGDGAGANDPSKGAAATGGRAQDARTDDDLDLDKLLAEAQGEGDQESERTSEDIEADKDAAKRLERLEKRLEASDRERAQKAADEALDATAREIKEMAGLENIPERVIKGLLYVKAEEDKRLLKAFANRESNPRAWNEIKKALSAEIGKDFDGLGENKLAEGIAATRAAVRGVSTKPAIDDSLKADPKALAAMSSDDFEKHVAKLRAAEAGAAR